MSSSDQTASGAASALISLAANALAVIRALSVIFKDSLQHSLRALFFWLIGSSRPNEKTSGRSTQVSRLEISVALMPRKVIEVPAQEETGLHGHVSISCLCRVLRLY